jgi:hypothetical protein
VTASALFWCLARTPAGAPDPDRPRERRRRSEERPGPRAEAFFSHVARHGEVWTLDDGEGLVAVHDSEGNRCVPFWASRAGAETFRASVTTHRWPRPVRMTAHYWLESVLPVIASDRTLVGIGWSGPRSQGLDLSASAAASALLSRRRGLARKT